MPNISKIFETLMNSRLKSYFFSNDLLSENQFGFRAGKNTELATLNLVHRLLPALKDKLYGIAIFLDFTACFDTLDRDLLTQKILKYGIDGNPLNFIKSYFCDRKFHVAYKGKNSMEFNQNFGVVQGSKNGPLLYDIYSNDLSFVLEENDYLFFADDTCLTFWHENYENLLSTVQSKLSIINDWCKFNKLAINPTKSECMIVTNRNIPLTPIIKIDNDSIQVKKCVKYLGLYIDDTLKFYSHADHLKSKLSQFQGVAFRLSKYMNLSTARKYYYACIYSVLSYCICTWGGTIEGSYRGKQLSKVHDKIVRLLFKKFFPNETNLFKQVKILKLVDIHRYYVSIQMFKLIRLNRNPFIQPLINIERNTHDYNTRLHNQLIAPFPRIESIRMNFEYQFVQIWNTIPLDVSNAISVSVLKKSY